MKKIIRTLALLFLPLILLGSVSVQANLKDPTKPAFVRPHKKPQQVKPVPKSVPLVINSILFSKQRKLAVINGVLVEIGDVVDKARIIEISRNYVVVVRDRKKIVLPFGHTIQKKARKSHQNSLVDEK